MTLNNILFTATIRGSDLLSFFGCWFLPGDKEGYGAFAVYMKKC
jgi:hypothetical protein